MNQYNHWTAAATTILAWMMLAFLFILTAAGIKWAWELLLG